ncbi:S49 family peptidase [Tardiphaga robiniae]|uniref:S49 family peptidase n=1 Tax=Tardiphaga robiniae TaxID=943830 RepID=UPI001586B347|nr:S49 family peptidase [Tardiphaga robiniae]NUU44549.1 S49 family peptidase [Tardiphaga robiniae]
MSGRDHGDVWAMLRAESQAWAIEPTRLSGMVALMARGERMAAPARNSNGAPAGIAVVGITGPLMRNGGMMSDYFGFSNYAAIRGKLYEALSDRSVSKILLYVDSPGGAATGCDELGADIAAAARVKPMAAFVDGLAASAGYWLASQAPQITMTTSGEVGSIGVLCLHTDVSRALGVAGIQPTFIVSRASPFKVEANSFEPLSAVARAHMQDGVDKVADRFISAVASGRRVSAATVRSNFGKGRTLRADAARAAGMVDRIGTLRDAVGLSGSSSTSATAQISDSDRIAYRRRRLELEAMTPQERGSADRLRRLTILEQS